MGLLLQHVKKHLRLLCMGILLVVSYAAVSVIPAAATQKIFDDGFARGALDTVIVLAIVLLLLAVMQSVLSVASTRCFSRMGETIACDLRNEMVDRALSMPSDVVARYGSAYLAARIEEVSLVTGMFSSTNFLFLSSIVQSVASIAIVTSINGVLGFIAVVPSFAFMALSWKATRVYKGLLRETMETKTRLTGRVAERLSGNEEIELNASKEEEKSAIHRAGARLKERGVKQSTLLGSVSEGFKVLNVAATCLVYIACGAFLIRGQITVGQVVAIVQYVAKIYTPIVMLSTTMVSIQPALEALNRMRDAFFSADARKVRGDVALCSFGRVRLEGLSFTYRDTSRRLLGGLSAELRCPSLVVIQGANGSGKTTLAKVLIGLYEGYGGAIWYDDVELRCINRDSLRSCSSMVNQSPFLFNATIRENVLYGCRQVSDERYAEVVRRVGLDRLYTVLPQGENTPIGEDGRLLSGGERQKVSLARALLKESRLVVMDEPTTGLDAESTEEVRKLACEMARDALVVVIDHSGVFDDAADQIIRL